MKKLNSVKNIGEDEIVILRMDTDLPMDDGQILDNGRLMKSVDTIKLLLERKNKIIIVGHLGRPDGIDKKFSLKPVYLELIEILEKDCGGDCVRNVFVEDIKDKEKMEKAIEENEIIFMENLRFWKGEENGDTTLFNVLKKFASVFVNDAFAVAHRKAASILLHKEMKTYYGLDFIEEVEKINQILENEKKPMVIVLGGAKEDKLKYLDELVEIADYVLIGGKLPKIIKTLRPSDTSLDRAANILVAELREDGLDLSDEDIEKFGEKIRESKTVVWAGAMGFYEKEDCRKGTEKIALAIAESGGYKIIAGGDTEASIVNLGLKNKIDFICSGGGVMLEMLVKKDLPAWD
jgi:phosphoglycerate kinase